MHASIDTMNVFSKANAEVMRNSLTVCPCVGGGWRWSGECGESLRSGCHSATVIQMRKGCRQKNKQTKKAPFGVT